MIRLIFLSRDKAGWRTLIQIWIFHFFGIKVNYRVFNKEGEKVKAYYTLNKYIRYMASDSI